MSEPIRDDEKALWARVEAGELPRYAGQALGIPSKRVAYLCEKWSRQGRYNYGVSVDMGWPEVTPTDREEQA